MTEFESCSLLKYLVETFFFFKLAIHYIGCDSSLCLQEELYMEYQYPNLFIQLSNIKDY